MAKRLFIEIFPDGQIKAEVKGFHGKECSKYIEVLEELLDAETVDSDYTEEYFNTEYEVIHKVLQEVIKDE